jgi:hypothetical protein
VHHPDSHDAQLGYTIYGKGQGQVNLERFSKIISGVKQHGATGATFWEINKPLALLHDGHMHMCTLTPDHPMGNYWPTVYSEMSLSGSNIISKPRFYYDSDGELQLKSMVIMRLLRITFNQLMGRMYVHYYLFRWRSQVSPITGLPLHWGENEYTFDL